MTNTLTINDLDLTNLSLYTYKNYNQVATTINQPILRGNAKTAQLKEWSRFFQWTTYGHKWTITDIYIYEKDKPKVARGDSVANLTYILGRFLLEKTPVLSEYNRVGLSLNTLAETFGLFNSTCSEYRYYIKQLTAKGIIGNDKPQLSDFNNYHIKQVMDRLEAKARKKIATVLKHFDSNYIIGYRKGYKVQYKGQVTYEIAEKELQVIIESSKSAALLSDRFRYSEERSTTEGDIYLKNVFKEFYNVVLEDSRLVELGVARFFPCYIFEFDTSLEVRLERYAKANKIHKDYRDKVKSEVKELMEKQRIAIQVRDNNIVADRMKGDGLLAMFCVITEEGIIKEEKLYSLQEGWLEKDSRLVEVLVD
jgi:hypothetical protein